MSDSTAVVLSQSADLSLDELVEKSLTPRRVKSAQDLVKRFFEGRKKTTIDAYQRDLAHFTKVIGGLIGRDITLDEAASILLANGDLGQAHAVADAYRAYMVLKEYAPNTINRRLTAVRSLVRVAKRYGLVEWTLETENVRSEASRDTKGYGLEGMRRQVRKAKERQDPKGVRDYTILRLNTDLGLRRASIAGLNIGDYDKERGVLSYPLKGRSAKERGEKELPEATKEAIERWLEAREHVRGPAGPDAPMFINFDYAGKHSPDQGRLTGQSVNRVIQAIGQMAGFSKMSSHRNRHAAITAALDATGGDIAAVQDFADHQDIRTTSKYNDNRNKQGSKIAKLVSLALED